MQRICAVSGRPFTISEADCSFYQNLGVPPPTLSPIERSRRRLAFHNERNLYWRRCATSGKRVISQYAEDTGVTVFEEKHWWSDIWDARDYGREFDFSQLFFPQWAALEKQVPHLPNHSGDNENAAYTSYSGWNKDCYMIFFSDHNRECFHSNHCFNDVDCADCSYVVRSELCFGSTTSEDCYECRFVQDCRNCAGSLFLKNCIGCKQCIGCINQRNKQYQILNEPCSKEDFERLLKQLQTRAGLAEFAERFAAFAASQPHKAISGTRKEHVSGEYISSSTNLKHCFHVEHCRDSAYLSDCSRTSDSYDVDGWGGTGAELLYECKTVGEGAHFVRFSNHCFSGVSDLDYCYSCMSSRNLFGCVGLRHSEYCILNKQYRREEYYELRERIIEHMKVTGEWGEFFPASLSHFAYNETVAHEYYPIGRGEALNRGLRWREPDPAAAQPPEHKTLPEKISETPDSLAGKLLACIRCRKNYSFQKAELQLYRKLALPLPTECPNCRHAERSALLNRRVLRDASCPRCGASIRTAHPDNCAYEVLCEACFQREIA